MITLHRIKHLSVIAGIPFGRINQTEIRYSRKYYTKNAYMSTSIHIQKKTTKTQKPQKMARQLVVLALVFVALSGIAMADEAPSASPKSSPPLAKSLLQSLPPLLWLASLPSKL
ncbi:hypothetical protein VNO80_08603 [Phaseolus coccineus]|uniref:Uncharacterized protein n=1 Tax=Phaseolus coccineus TaxID=3886 RepID=A0AAN9NB10_PHACN